MTQWKRHTFAEVKEKVYEKHGDNISIVGEYVSARDKIKAHCNVCGTDWEPIVDNLFRGEGCPICGRKRTIEARTLTNENFLRRLNELQGDLFTPLVSYKGWNNKILVLCNKCNNTWEVSPASLLNSKKKGCPKCWELRRGKSKRLPPEKVEQIINEVHRGNITILEPYVTAHDKRLFLCNVCGKTWKAIPDAVKRGSGCPHCATKSWGENIIKAYLNENGIEYIEQYKIDTCKNIRSLPFDFKIIAGNEKWCLLEYDGIQHYDPAHQFVTKINEDKLNEIRRRDKLKDDFCEENGIILFRIKYIKGNRTEYRKKLYSKMDLILLMLTENGLQKGKYVYQL